MSKLRKLIYINTYLEESRIVYYGIEFKEFANALLKPLNNILLIKHNFCGDGDDFHFPTRFEYVKNDNLNQLLDADVYHYGDFCWVDFEDVTSLDLLEPNEIADVLYLGHMGKPLNSPFFEKLRNNYVYGAHDDGWHNQLYCKNISDFSNVIAKAVISRTVTTTRRNVDPISDEIGTQLLEMSSEGLLIDLNNIIKDRNSIQIPIYIIGKLVNMDDMYNHLERYKENSLQKCWLVYKKKCWTLEK